MRVRTARKPGHLPNGAIRIGTVARRFGVSVDLLRLYEREGLLIPLKSPRGTRYFGEHDYLWIGTLLRLIREVHLNCAGVRRLLATLPCWRIRQCPFERQAGCAVILDPAQPCWMNRRVSRPQGRQDCYFCPVYRSAPGSESLRALLAAPERAAARPQPAESVAAGKQI